MEKNLFKIENLFLVICLFFGIVFTLINPPIQSPDEFEHFCKMWGYTEGTLRYQIKNDKTGQYLPTSLSDIYKFYSQYFLSNKKIPVSSFKNFSNLELNQNNKLFLEIVPTSYTPLSYFPSFLILWIMKILNIKPFFMLYIMRFCSLLVYLALSYYAIKIVPYKKWMFFLFTLLPVNLLQATAISTDCISTGIIILFLAYSLKLAFDDSIKKLNNKQIFIWGTLTVIIGILKFAYLPIIFIYFLIPKEKLPLPNHFYTIFLSVLAINIILAGGYILFLMLTTNTQGLNSVVMFNKFELLKNIFSSPIDYLKLLGISTLIAIPFVLQNMISSIGINLNFKMIPITYIYLSWFSLIISSIFCSEQISKKLPVINLKQKIILFSAILFSYFIILTSLYIVFPTEHLTKGLQGRYLTPLIPIGLFLLHSNKYYLKWKVMPFLFLLTTIILSTQTLFTIIKSYY